LKKFILLFFTILLIFNSNFLYADENLSEGLERITVYYSSIKIFYNGKEVELFDEPFIYKGKTFLPVRQITEIFNKEVRWDKDKRTIHINDNPQEKDMKIEMDKLSLELLLKDKEIKELTEEITKLRSIINVPNNP
jgi:hypothetical protein